MLKNPPEGMPRVTPYLYYKDVKAALDWLAKTFGLETRLEVPGPDGSIMHAEMVLEDGVVMMGPACKEQGSKSPLELPAVNQSLYIYVDDVDGHYQSAVAAGARIISEPVDMFWGDRIYVARDIEDHRWVFAEHVKDIAPEDMEIPGI